MPSSFGRGSEVRTFAYRIDFLFSALFGSALVHTDSHDLSRVLSFRVYTREEA